MGVGGEGAVKKTTRGRTVEKVNNKHKKKVKSKVAKSSESRYKSPSKKPTERKTSYTSRKSSGNLDNQSTTTNDGNSIIEVESAILGNRNIGTLVKPKKTEKSSLALLSDESGCCVCCMDRSVTPAPCTCNEFSNAHPQPTRDEMEAQATACIAQLSKERDYFRTEFERLLNLVEKLENSTEAQERNKLQCIACDKKDQTIEYLRRENQVLAKEKYILMTRLEEGGTRLDMQSPAGKCQKAPCKRLEREAEMLKFDIQRLEEENDCLREKIKAENEYKSREYAKSQDQRIEYENVISKLEGERRELIKAQGIRRVTINSLEEKVHTYSDLLQVAHDEKERFKNQYHQLKKLHDQCDKALLDTQAQLMELETELMFCKENPSIINTYVTENGAYYSAKDGQRKVGPFKHENTGLQNALDRRTVDYGNNGGRNDETISRLEEQSRTLKDKLREMENEVTSWKEKYKKIEMILEEKVTDIRNLQNENTKKCTELKKMQNDMEETEKHSLVVQAEVEHLNKETNALVNTNHQQQGDIQQFKIQVSVAMERVHELENKVAQLEKTILEYEKQMRLLRNDSAVFQFQTAEKEKEIDMLLKNKQNLEHTMSQLDIETEGHKRKICDLECQCQKLQTNLMDMTSKEKLISDLTCKLSQMKTERNALEREYAELSKKANIMETKLFQCICTICDNAQDKCTMLNCFLKGQADLSSRGGTFVNVMVSDAGTKDVATQVHISGGGSRNPRVSTISPTQDALPREEEKPNKVITVRNVLQSRPHQDNTVPYPVYQAVDRTSPLSIEKYDDQSLQKLSLTAENKSTEIDEMLNSIHEFQLSSLNSSPRYRSAEGKEFMKDDATTTYELTQIANSQKM